MENIAVAPTVDRLSNIQVMLWDDYAQKYNYLLEVIKKTGVDTDLLRDLVVTAVKLDRIGFYI